jgi:hypothetical protein
MLQSATGQESLWRRCRIIIKKINKDTACTSGKWYVMKVLNVKV